MNRLIFTLAAAGAASVLFASEATLTGGVLSIVQTEAGNLSAILTDAQVAALRSGAVTSVAKSGNFELVNDLETAAGFAGDWNIEAGAFTVLNPSAIGAGAIRTQGTKVGLLNGGVYTNDVHFGSSATGTLEFNGGEMRGDVTSAANLNFNGTKRVACYGRLTLPGRTLTPGGSSGHDFHGAITADLVYSGFVNATHVFFSPENAVGVFTANYGCFRFASADCATGSVLRHGYTESHNSEGNFRGSFYVDADQTIDRVDWPTQHADTASAQGAAWGHATYLSNQARLTMRATADQITETYFGGNGSLCWNPVDAYTLTLTNDRLHKVSGTFTVSNGCVRLTGATRFEKLALMDVVAGARLVCDTTSAMPFRALKLGLGATLEIPASRTVEVCQMSLAGAWLANGTYSDEPWLTGGGTLKVTDSEGLVSWRSAVDGNWSESAKWSAGVPAAAAFVTAEGADYTVGLDPARLAAGTITLGNDPDHVATLQAANDLEIADGTVLAVQRGGRWLQTGGTVALTNRTASFTVGDGGLWEQTGGLFVYHHMQGKEFVVNRGGTFRISGGESRFVNVQMNYNTTFRIAGGQVDVCGTGKLNFPSSNGSSYNLGPGRTRIRGNGTLAITTNSSFDGTASEAAQVDVLEDGHVDITDSFTLYNNAVLTIAGSSSANKLGLACRLRGTTVPARLDIRAGAYAHVDSYGLFVGYKDDTAAACPTGIVDVAGGLLVGGDAINWGVRPTSWDGTAIGAAIGSTYAPRSGDAKLRPTYGELNVTGVFTNKSGYCAIGAGACATGVVNLRGGAFTSQSRLPVPVGFGGGAGVVDVSAGGSFRVAQDLYVGGMETNVVSKFFSNFVEAEQPTADGTVRVADATVAVGGNLVLGSLGTGTLVLAPGAAVTAVDLVLSNRVASCVEVDLGTGDAPAGRVDLSGMLDIAPGARLVIDGSACSGGRTLFPLVRAAGGIRGAFAPENVVCLGRDIGYRVTANGIDAYVTRGTVLIFR